MFDTGSGKRFRAVWTELFGVGSRNTRITLRGIVLGAFLLLALNWIDFILHGAFTADFELVSSVTGFFYF